MWCVKASETPSKRNCLLYHDSELSHSSLSGDDSCSSAITSPSSRSNSFYLRRRRNFMVGTARVGRLGEKGVGREKHRGWGAGSAGMKETVVSFPCELENKLINSKSLPKMFRKWHQCPRS